MDLTQRPWRAFNALLYSIIPTPFFSLPLSRPSPLFQAGRASPGICRALGGRRQLQTNASSPFHPSRTQTRHQYEIHLENSSVVELCPDEEDIPNIFFNVRGGGGRPTCFSLHYCCVLSGPAGRSRHGDPPSWHSARPGGWVYGGHG